MAESTYTLDQVRAATWVLSEALQTARADYVLVVCDEYTEDTALCLRTVGEAEVGARVEILTVPFDEQRAFSKCKAELPDKKLRKLVESASRVIILQRIASDVSYFRLNLLEYCQRSHQRRAASMPGVTLDYLPLCLGDLDKITQRCQHVADLMVRSTSARLVTRSVAGRELELSMRLGQHKPIKSTGRIEAGDWGNVPSGEIFIVPDQGTTKGMVAINGSLLDYPIPSGEDLVLRLRDGIVESPVAATGGTRSASSRLLFDEFGREVFSRCSELCELGIGTNEHITRFTGMQLFDEKILGTVHLGFGRNKQFGGNIDSPVHHDLVIRDPALFLDEIPVTQGGCFVLQESDVYPNWRTLRRNAIAPSSEIRAGPQTSARDGNTLFLKWMAPRSLTEQRTQVGDDETSAMAARILDLVEEEKEPIQVSRIPTILNGGVDDAAVSAVVALLARFRLIELT